MDTFIVRVRGSRGRSADSEYRVQHGHATGSYVHNANIFPRSTQQSRPNVSDKRGPLCGNTIMHRTIRGWMSPPNSRTAVQRGPSGPKKKRSLKDCALNPPKEEVLEETSDWHPTCAHYAPTDRLAQALFVAMQKMQSRIVKHATLADGLSIKRIAVRIAAVCETG